MNHKTTLIFLVLLALSNCGDYQIVYQSQERGAACLDGSPPAMYVHQGSEPNRDKFLIYVQGGGWCGEGGLDDTLEACYLRSFSALGSSEVLNSTRTFDDQIGYLSTV